MTKSIRNIFPFVSWFKGYRPAFLKGDLFSGLTVALVLIPQSMAYAQLAGLPAHHGLYASFLPPAVAALFGSSRQLATGPVAVVALMTATALEPLAASGGEAYIAYAVLLSLMVGVFQFLIGALRLGMVVNFLSHPVINGFTNAAALIIASSQLAGLLGVHVDKAARHYETVRLVLEAAARHIHWPTLLMGATAFAIIVGLNRISPKIPGILAAVAITTVISWAAGFERKEIVALDAIAHPGARSLIRDFNAAVRAVEPLAEERSRLTRASQEAGKRGDAIARITSKRDAEIATHRIRMKMAEAADHRRRIRHLLFEGEAGENGALRLHPRGALPDGVEGDGRTHRILVGAAPLDLLAIPVSSGGEVIGAIPGGLPAFRAPGIDPDAVRGLAGAAVVIALLGFMEAISVAKAMAAKTGQRIDPNQELIGQGLANIVGSFSKGWPGAGSFSRSAVNLRAGAFTGMSSVFTCLTVVIALLFLTPLLHHLPRSVLAAIIMVAVTGLINVRGFIHAWKAQWFDGVISVITFACTLAFAPHLDRGILVGVCLSLGVFLYKSMRPTVVDLSLGVDMALHDAVSFGLKECKYIDVVRFDGPLFFANASYLEDQIRHRRRTKEQLRHIIIAAEGINEIDASGEEALSLTVDRVRAAGIDISLSGVNESVMKVLARTHLLAKIGEDHIHASMKTAIGTVHGQSHAAGEEEACPLTTFCGSREECEIE